MSPRALRMVVLTTAIGLGGCGAIDRAKEIHDIRGGRAQGLATPEILEQCRLAVLQKVKDFKPITPIRPDSDAGLKFTGALNVDQKLPNGGSVVAFSALYEQSNIFGQVAVTRAGCIYELTENRLILVKAFTETEINPSTVIVF